MDNVTIVSEEKLAELDKLFNLINTNTSKLEWVLINLLMSATITYDDGDVYKDDTYINTHLYLTREQIREYEAYERNFKVPGSETGELDLSNILNGIDAATYFPTMVELKTLLVSYVHLSPYTISAINEILTACNAISSNIVLPYTVNTVYDILIQDSLPTLSIISEHDMATINNLSLRV